MGTGRDGGEPGEPGDEVRGSARLLVDPAFGPFFFGMMLWTVATWVHNLAAAVVVFDLTGSTLLVGTVSVALFGPQFLLTPLMGALADRVDRRRQLVAGRLLSAAGAGVLTAWVVVAGLDAPGSVPVLIGASCVIGVGFTVGGPAMQALVPALVRPGEMAAAVSLAQMPWTVARAAGPALGALLLATAGPAYAFGASTAGNLAFGLILLALRIRPVQRAATGDRSVWAGVRHLRIDPPAALLLLGLVAVGFGSEPVITLAPAVAAAYGGGTELVGVLASAFGVGAAAAFFVIDTARRRFGLALLGPVGLLILAVGLAFLALSPDAGYAVAALIVGGVGMTLALTSLSSLLQERVPEELRGRIMALWLLALLGSRPLAAAFSGAVADLVSSGAALVMVAAMLAGAAALTRPSQIARVPPPA